MNHIELARRAVVESTAQAAVGRLMDPVEVCSSNMIVDGFGVSVIISECSPSYDGEQTMENAFGGNFRTRNVLHHMMVNTFVHSPSYDGEHFGFSNFLQNVLRRLFSTI